MRCGGGVFVQLTADVCGVAQRESQQSRVAARPQQRDRLGIVDRRTNAVVRVATSLRQAQQSLGANGVILRLGFRGGFLVQALSLGRLARAACLCGLLQDGFYGF